MDLLSKFEKRGLSKLKRVKKTWKNIFILTITSFVIYVLFVLHTDLSKTENLLNYCYAFFVGNIAASSGLFSFGRSNIILKRNDDVVEENIHLCGFYYLCAAIIGLFTSGLAYMHIKGTLPSFQTNLHQSIVFWILSIFVTLSAAVSFLATSKFFSIVVMEIISMSKK